MKVGIGSKIFFESPHQVSIHTIVRETKKYWVLENDTKLEKNPENSDKPFFRMRGQGTWFTGHYSILTDELKNYVHGKDLQKMRNKYILFG